MVITTQSGAKYRIVDGLCKKYDSDGIIVDVFKVWDMRAVEPGLESWEDLAECNSEIQIGKRMYISGKDNWWITTPVVSITETGS
jgi:hypothetical protein